MAHAIHEYRERTVDNGEGAATDRSVAESEYHRTVAERVVYYIGGVIMALIALRIILSLMGANHANAFASFIYSVSYPFVAPFFGLFNYTMRYGVSRFEFESFIALIVWGLITVGVAKLVSLGSRRDV